MHMGKKVILIMAVALCASKAASQCCVHTLIMQDSYGDGWNGGSLQVSLDEVIVGVFACSGPTSDTTFLVCDGNALELIYTAGDFEDENTFTLFGPAGSILFTDGPSPEPGPVFMAIGDCSYIPVPGTVPCAALPIDTANCVIANNSDASGTNFDPGCAEFQGNDIWYTMQVPASGAVVVSTNSTGGLNDTGIALWTGTDCIQLTLQSCDDDGGPEYFSQVLGSELPVGETLYIQVFGYGGGQGAFELCVADPGTVILESSELPIVMINTLGQTIMDEPKINALMEVKYNGAGNLTYVSGPANDYSGPIGIEIRGASSSDYPQRPYGVETRTDLGENNDVSILGMPEENDWVLLSNYNDRSLVRNQLAFAISTGMGEYAPRTHLCELLIDSVYKGTYLFGEKIKRDDGRVNIAKLTGTENAGDDLTGGYILQQNYWDNFNSFQSNYSPIDHPDLDVHFVHEYPEPDTITNPQRTYIASFVDSLETALYSTDFADPVLGYRRFLDVPSFIHYFLVNEISRSNDGFKKSVFFHKDKASNGGKLKAGPVWDFDWAWKDLATCDIFSNTDGSGWAHLVNDCFTDNHSCGWYVRLLQDSTFNNELRCAYSAYRADLLSTTSLFNFIDSVGAHVQSAQARHFQKWPILGLSGPAPEVNPSAITYAAELDSLKGWIARRLLWLDANIPGQCINTPITERAGLQPLTVLPNPSDGHFQFAGTLDGPGPFALAVFDLTGRAVADRSLNAGAHQFSLELDAAGAYTFTLVRGTDVLQHGRLIVQH